MRVASMQRFVVGEERALVADHFELHPVRQPGLAAEPRRADRFVGRVAAGGVRQQEVLRRVDVVEQRFLRAVGDVHAPHRDRDHLGARRLVRLHHHGRRRVLAGADDQARGKGLVRDSESCPKSMSRSPAADEVHDFDLIALVDDRLVERGALEHDEVVLDGDAPRVDRQLARSSFTVRGPGISKRSPLSSIVKRVYGCDVLIRASF